MTRLTPVTPADRVLISELLGRRCDGELTSPIFIRVDPHDYDALCDEEAAREASTQKERESTE